MEKDPQVPIAYPIAEEEAVALPHLVQDLQGQEALDRAATQIVDVVVTGDRVVLAPRVGPADVVDRTVDLQDDGALEVAVLVDREVEVGVRDGDQSGLAVEGNVEELTLLFAVGHVDGEVVRLLCLVARLL